MFIVVPLAAVAALVLAVVSVRGRRATAPATHDGESRPSSTTANRYTQISFWALAAVPVSVLLGVVLLLALIGGDPNAADAPQRWDNAWRVTVAWVVMILPAVVGTVFGWRAMTAGERRGRVAMALNVAVVLVFTGLTLVGGILDGF